MIPYRQLAEARIALRTMRDAFRVARALAEQRVSEAATLLGSPDANLSDRQFDRTVALSVDPDYVTALVALRAAQADVDRLQAEVDTALAAEAVLDRASRDRLTAVLERLAVDQDSAAGKTATVQNCRAA